MVLERPPKAAPIVAAVRIDLTARTLAMLLGLQLQLGAEEQKVPSQREVIRRGLVLLAEQRMDPARFAELPPDDRVDEGEVYQRIEAAS